MRIVLATRGSPLALEQAEEARRLLRLAHPEAVLELKVVRSSGSRDGFTPEIDRAVLHGEADAGVHGLEDMTTSLEPGLALGGTLARAAAEDVLVSREGAKLAELSPRARVAADSSLRAALIQRARPDLEVVALRGDIETRLEQLALGAAEALVLARAGLAWLGLADRITEVLGPPGFLPAVGQGIVGLTCRADDERVGRALSAISDREAWAEASCERALLRALRGDCNAPIGARARAVENGISVRACVLSADGTECVEGERSGPIGQAEELGMRLAEDLAARGASRLVEAARSR